VHNAFRDQATKINAVHKNAGRDCAAAGADVIRTNRRNSERLILRPRLYDTSQQHGGEHTESGGRGGWQQHPPEKERLGWKQGRLLRSHGS
jgi:hypothetical protein